MPRYNVIVSSPATVSTVVDVEAPDAKLAGEKALAEAIDSPHAFTWTLDDGNQIEPYLGDPDGAELVEEGDDHAT